MPLEAELDCVTIDYADRGFVVEMSEVERFHAEGPADAALELRSLDPLLGAAAPETSRAAHVLVVRRGDDGGAGFGWRTRGTVRLVRAREAALFRLPRVLREAGCQAWVRGVLAADREPGATGPLRIWISLLQLAWSVERER
jgi:hypothetical protein